MTLQQQYDAAFTQLEAAVGADEDNSADAAERYEAALASFEAILALEDSAERRALIQRKLAEHWARLAALKRAKGDRAWEAAIKLDERVSPRRINCRPAALSSLSLYSQI